MDDYKTMFEQAHQNTLEIMKKLVVFEDNMTEQLNFMAKQAIVSAKTEIAFAPLANIPFESLSSVAQQLYNNPKFTLEKKFELTDLIDAPKQQVDIFEESAPEMTANKVDTKDGKAEIYTTEHNDESEIFVKSDDKYGIKAASDFVDEHKKPHSTKRREWIAVDSTKIKGACEVKVLLARLTENDEKRFAKEDAEQANKKDEGIEQIYYNL